MARPLLNAVALQMCVIWTGAEGLQHRNRSVAEQVAMQIEPARQILPKHLSQGIAVGGGDRVGGSLDARPADQVHQGLAFRRRQGGVIVEGSAKIEKYCAYDGHVASTSVT